MQRHSVTMIFSFLLSSDVPKCFPRLWGMGISDAIFFPVLASSPIPL